jgi:hypothetical protein
MALNIMTSKRNVGLFFSFMSLLILFALNAELTENGISFTISQAEVFILLCLHLVILNVLPALANLLHYCFSTHVVLLFYLLSFFLTEKYVRRKGLTWLLLSNLDFIFLYFNVHFEILTVELIPKLPLGALFKRLKDVVVSH